MGLFSKARAIFGAVLLVLSMIAATSFAIAPSLPLLWLHYPTFRFLTGRIVSLWQDWAAYLFETYFGMQYVVTGDPIVPGAALALSNHRTRLDWAFLWPVLTRRGITPLLHIFLKSDIKKIPFMGWGTQCCRYLFLDRKWEADVANFTAMLRVIARGGRPQPTPDAQYFVLIFPEGTDLHAKALERSAAFAKENGLPEYRFVLHPRARGFIAATRELQAVPQGAGAPLADVYDITLGYAGAIAQNEAQLATGKTPSRVHCHVRRFPAAALPASDEALAAWLAERFAEKEAALELFYSSTGASDLASAFDHAIAARRAGGGVGVSTAASSLPAPGGSGPQPLSPGDIAASVAPQPIGAYVRGIAAMTAIGGAAAYAAFSHPLLTLAYIVTWVLVFKHALPALGGVDGIERRLVDPTPGKPPRLISVPEKGSSSSRTPGGAASSATPTPTPTPA